MTFKVKLNFKGKIYPILSTWVCPCDQSPPIEVSISKFGPKMHLSTVKVPIDLGLDWPWSSVSFLISNLCFFYQTLRLLLIRVCLYIFSEAIASECFTIHRALHICGFFYARGKGPAVDREAVFSYLGVTIGAQWAVDLAIGTGFYKLLSVYAKLSPLHMPQFYIPTISNHWNNSKIAPISHYLVPTSTGKALALVASYAILSAEGTRHRDTGYPVCSTS